MKCFVLKLLIIIKSEIPLQERCSKKKVNITQTILYNYFNIKTPNNDINLILTSWQNVVEGLLLAVNKNQSSITFYQLS